MRLVFLGTNGWFNTETARTVSTLLETEDAYVVFDAGDGITGVDRFLKHPKPLFLLISHLHLDHISGFHAFGKFSFPGGITVCGASGIRGLIERVITSPFSLELDKLSYPVAFREISDLPQDKGFSLRALPLQHPVPCLGYRLTAGGKVIAYCCDTGYCENAHRLAQDADILIAECSLQDTRTGQEAPHMNAVQAARLAQEAGVKQLVLTHFNPVIMPARRERGFAADQAGGISPGTIAACDGMEIEL
ncbi:MAG: ribonuclease Z [Candidatus Omnitrophica bacterium]|nr:ribonuclease Z [Candidatus Omnitrophota bacterium]